MTYSHELFQQAQSYIPGGVNSPVRAFNGVGGEPIFFKQGKGAYLIDVDDKHYIDYVGSWGPMILGHSHPQVKRAVLEAVEYGLSFGAPTESEVLMANALVELMPSIEKVRMVNSGTEATMTAIRLARGISGRDKIVKFEGCYHGHSDSLLVKGGSGILTLGLPNSLGVTANVAQDTLTLPYNDINAAHQLFEHYGDQIAAVIVEPVAGNMGCILPKEGFLTGLRSLCDEYSSILIFDEVMTGFRVALGGAQDFYQVTPDLTTLGKIIGGGMPVGALGGAAKYMNHLAPLGGVYQAGTLSGNPIAMAAGIATLNAISEPHFYQELEKTTKALTAGLNQLAHRYGIPFQTTQAGGMFGLCFTEDDVIENYQQMSESNTDLFKRFFHEMLNRGIYFAPSAFEAGFVSAAHGNEEIELTLEAAQSVFECLQGGA